MTIVQTYTPSNPYAHKANFAILFSWMPRLKKKIIFQIL
jgi:hypothetical protein